MGFQSLRDQLVIGSNPIGPTHSRFFRAPKLCAEQKMKNENAERRWVCARELEPDATRCRLEPSRWPVLLITLSAVHRSSFRRLERDLGVSSAVGTLHVMHFPWAGTESAIGSAASVGYEDYLL